MSQKINLQSLIETIAHDAAVEPELIRHFIHEFGEVIEEGLVRDGKVRIHDFGTFSLHWANRRVVKSPQTGEPIEIPGSYRVHFRPAKSLREAVNRRYAHLKPILLEEPTGSISLEDASTEEELIVREKFKQEPEEADTVEDELSALERSDLEKAQTASFERPAKIPPQQPATGDRKLSYSEDTWSAREKKQLNSSNRGLIWVSLLFIILAILVVFVYFQKHHKYFPKNYEKVTSNQQSAPSEKFDGQTSMDSETKRFIERSTAFKLSELDTEKSYQITYGDNLWNLASRYYEQPYWWPYIYDANRSFLNNPDSLEIGVNLKIPNLQGTTNEPTTQDKRKVALGYFNAYLAYKKLGYQNAFYFLQQAVSLDSTIKNTRRNEIANNDLQRLQTMKNNFALKKIYSDER